MSLCDHFLSTLAGAAPATREEQIRLAQDAVFYYRNWDKVQHAVDQGPPDEGVTLSGRPDTPRQRQFWWVNHKQTHRQELEGEYLWSPKVNQNGSHNESYENMTRVYPGDVVFSFADAAIRAIGVAMGRARQSVQPAEFGKAGMRWTKDLGWQVPVRFMRLAQPLKPKLHMPVLEQLLPDKYSPIRASGDGNQSIYLAHLPVGMAHKICELLNGRAEEIISQIGNSAGTNLAEAAEQVRLEQRLDIGPTEKMRLTKARAGQGVYRTNLELFEKSCRVTGVTDPDHMRASHIKPWCKCDDREKLDGHNGLLLAPHVDHLFDKGHLSFSDTGDVMISKYLDPTLLARWGISIRNVGAFRPEQFVYLDYHRRHIFEQRGKSSS